MKKPVATGREQMLEVLKQFRVLLRSIRRHYQWVEKQCGVSGAQLWALAEIDSSPGISVTDLAGRLAIHVSTASNLLKRLDTLELIVRTRVADNQRVVRVHVTEKGKDILKKAPRPFAGILQQALLELPPARLGALNAELVEVVRRIKIKDTKAGATPLSEM